MSDWEDFCESNGWNAGSEDDYDKFLDSLEDRPRRRIQREFSSATSVEGLYFTTFQEAVERAKNTIGKYFTRNPNGSGFIPKSKKGQNG